jgi:hypothetical protein
MLIVGDLLLVEIVHFLIRLIILKLKNLKPYIFKLNNILVYYKAYFCPCNS